MTNATPNALTAADRALFSKIADVLLPAHGKLPGAASVDVAGELLDHVMLHRPDLFDAFIRGLRAVSEKTGRAAAEELIQSDGEAFDAIGLAASGAYFMSPIVRDRLGYPGQESVVYDPHAVPEYESNGMLDRVRARGSVFRDARRSRP
jgi:hypothetical protein